jgi:hypothetical protein
MISEGRGPERASWTAHLPLISASWSRRLSGAGIAAFPGNAMPNASAMLAIVDAVPITMHEPAERQIESSMSPYSSALSVPARSSVV